MVGHYWLEVANNVFNDVDPSSLVILSCHPRLAAWHRAIRSPYTIAMAGEWSAVLALHYSCIVATCLHVLQASSVVPARTSCKAMMALTLGALETYVRTLGIGEPCCTSRPTSLFFMLEAHSPQGTVGHVETQSPPRREAGSGATGHVVHQSPPSESGATVHVVAPEPFSSGRRVPESLDTWQPPEPTSARR
jgi:hypothetical protein